MADRRSYGADKTAQCRLTHSAKPSSRCSCIAVAIAILIAAVLIKGGDSGGVANGGGNDEFIARRAWLYVSIVTAGYLVSRGLAKTGSRDPYTADDATTTEPARCDSGSGRRRRGGRVQILGRAPVAESPR